MFDNWKKRRKLNQELAEIDKAYASDFRAAKTQDDYNAVRSVYDIETAETVSELRWMQTAKLRRRAKKFGLELQPHGWLIVGEEPYWETNPHTNRTYLSDAGIEKLSHEIVDARFAYWKRWVEILAPTASVIISLLALGLAALALYLQLTGMLSPQR